MQVTNLRSALNKQPFRPFKIRTGSGESYSVNHPEVAWVQPEGEVVIVFIKKENEADVVMIDVESITEVVYDKLARGTH